MAITSRCSLLRVGPISTVTYEDQAAQLERSTLHLRKKRQTVSDGFF
jgi:hypothetical protein